jgi:hypothetical protein
MNMNMNMSMSVKHTSYDCSNSETVISEDTALHVFRHGLLPKHAAASTTSSPQPRRRLNCKGWSVNLAQRAQKTRMMHHGSQLYAFGSSLHQPRRRLNRAVASTTLSVSHVQSCSCVHVILSLTSMKNMNMVGIIQTLKICSAAWVSHEPTVDTATRLGPKYDRQCQHEKWRPLSGLGPHMLGKIRKIG